MTFLFFPAAPEITFQPNDGLEMDGNVLSPLSVSMQCVAQGRPTPEIAWYRNGTEIVPNGIISECDILFGIKKTLQRINKFSFASCGQTLTAVA